MDGRVPGMAAGLAVGLFLVVLVLIHVCSDKKLSINGLALCKGKCPPDVEPFRQNLRR